jgi:hypothetical protein
MTHMSDGLSVCEFPISRHVDEINFLAILPEVTSLLSVRLHLELLGIPY